MTFNHKTKRLKNQALCFMDCFYWLFEGEGLALDVAAVGADHDLEIAGFADKL